MQNNKLFLLSFILCGAIAFNAAFAQDVSVDEMEQVSADAIADYDVQGSLFQQITDLEQEKILMQLEKERAQLDLELDRLAAEKIKLHMEIDTLSGRAEQQQQEIETQKAKLEAEAVRIEREKEALLADKNTPVTAVQTSVKAQKSMIEDITKSYKLVNVVGAGNQLQATIADLESGQTKRISVGKKLNNWTVKSISLDEGVVFVSPDGEVQNLNVSNGN